MLAHGAKQMSFKSIKCRPQVWSNVVVTLACFSFTHTHTSSHVFYDFTMPLVMATQNYVHRRSWCTSICLSINPSIQPTSNQPTWKQLCYKSFKIQEIIEKILSHAHTIFSMSSSVHVLQGILLYMLKYL